MSGNNLPTVSGAIDAKSRGNPYRHSLQPKTHTEIPNISIKRHNSLGKSRITNNLKKPSVPDIPEAEKSEDDTSEDVPNLAKQDVTAGEDTRVSFTKKSRKTSNISKTSRTSVQSGINNVERGIVNYSYDQSNRSSLHGSVSSLPVIREQYCCCARWTKLEKNLALIVAILALIIIGLVIAVGLVARHNKNNSPSYTLPALFRF